MSSTMISLFNPSFTSEDLAREHDLAQEIIFYCESRLRSALISYNQADKKKKIWMIEYLHSELVGYVIYFP